MRIGWSGLSGGKACASSANSERAPSGSRLGLRGGAASRSSLRALIRLRSGATRVLAGAFVVLALGVLAAPLAQAQTVSNLTVTAVSDSGDKLDVSWNAPAGANNYHIRWS